jgi:hypothetical protein
MQTWMRSKKHDLLVVAIAGGLIALFVLALPYCC